jgi:hypothetical protein
MDGFHDDLCARLDRMADALLQSGTSDVGSSAMLMRVASSTIRRQCVALARICGGAVSDSKPRGSSNDPRMLEPTLIPGLRQ